MPRSAQEREAQPGTLRAPVFGLLVGYLERALRRCPASRRSGNCAVAVEARVATALRHGPTAYLTS